ncbi:hypothetical protein SAMN05428972_0866 [Rhodanobacter sp. OK091]|nr:hypothetical protein SAMN05428972_0866 [Rhodanobacter sp. OK091]
MFHARSLHKAGSHTLWYRFRFAKGVLPNYAVNRIAAMGRW